MDTPTLPLGHLEEGGHYLASVESLGLRPNALFWAYDKVIGSFVLVLISEAFDAVGPLELSKLLFKAYNAEATPRTIDPFIIRIHSPEHRVVREMDKIMPFKVAFTPTLPDGSLGVEQPAKSMRAVAEVDGLQIDGDWVYRFDKPLTRTKTVDVLRKWHRFQTTVEQIAA